MSADFSGLGRALLIAGLLLAGLGVVFILGAKSSWLGRLPGDVLIQRERWSVYVPWMTCLVVSVVLSLILWLIGRWR